MAKTDHTRLRASRSAARKRSTDHRRGAAAARPLDFLEKASPPHVGAPGLPPIPEPDLAGLPGIRYRLEGAVALAACARQAARANFAEHDPHVVRCLTQVITIIESEIGRLDMTAVVEAYTTAVRRAERRS